MTFTSTQKFRAPFSPGKHVKLFIFYLLITRANCQPWQYRKSLHRGGHSTPTQQQAMLIIYPTVFDGQIRSMEGEHISLTDGVKPLHVTTPQSIPFAYRDKLKAEMELLESQNIIVPVTEATEWCPPIVATPKKDTDCVRMCLSSIGLYAESNNNHLPLPKL